MKTFKNYYLTICFLLFTPGIFAQLNKAYSPAIPLKQGSSVLFGKDIIINDQPPQNQQNVAICSAFNGWLLAAYSYNTVIRPHISILKSSDGGLTWDVLLDGPAGFEQCIVPKVDIIAAGTSMSTLKLFLGFVYFDTIAQSGSAFVGRYNVEPFASEGEILNEFDYVRDIALASDNTYPAQYSNPFSIGVLYSKHSTLDSIIFRSSSNGGVTLNNRRVVAVTTNTSKILHKVTLAYGYSPSHNNGNYFAAWEEKDYVTPNLGHIFTAHSTPGYNGTFTSPKCLDSLDASAIKLCRNPVIVCQVNNLDNDSSNLSEIVSFEKYLPATNNYDIIGYYNQQAIGSSHFKPLNFAVTSDNELQPDLTFNSFDNNFLMTYFDSTTRKLPLLSNDFNLANPNNWNVVSTGYNDSANLKAASPKIRINEALHQAVQAWIAERIDGEGIAMSDAEYSTYTDIQKNYTALDSHQCRVFPNPCSTKTNIEFELKKAGNVTLSLHNVVGKKLAVLADRDFPSGKQKITVNMSGYPLGTYFYTFNSEEFSSSGRICVLR